MRWGVLGAADIALRKVIPGMRKARGAQVHAIASRDAARARAAADACGAPQAYGDYEALLADPEIEAVYIPLPNHLHVPWTVRALEAGKHVLCEKPIALTAAEAATLIAARDRSGRGALEAFMVRQHPQWLRARHLVREGALGEARLVQACFAYVNEDPANIRNRADAGGGALFDIGCYALVFARFLFGAEPLRVAAFADRDPASGVDRLTGGLADFGGGRLLNFTVATRLSGHQRVQILGDRGRIEIPVALNAPPDESCRLLIDRTGAIDGGGVSVEHTEPCDQYALQAETAMRVFRGEEPAEFPIEDAVANMRAIDALFRAAASGAWEAV